MKDTLQGGVCLSQIRLHLRQRFSKRQPASRKPPVRQLHKTTPLTLPQTFACPLATGETPTPQPAGSSPKPFYFSKPLNLPTRIKSVSSRCGS